MAQLPLKPVVARSMLELDGLSRIGVTVRVRRSTVTGRPVFKRSGATSGIYTDVSSDPNPSPHVLDGNGSTADASL